ncbi:MAG: hypothetical protein BWY74_03995 [Firmicutes bacterium ADurb.Bin419]|nr:MAG: hypothetical protein BWY74_03995 [Firmicutes bacterium ADurb.Bin419]
MNPRTSVTVVTKTDEARAGSTPIFFKAIGTKYPAKAATIILRSIAVPKTNPKTMLVSLINPRKAAARPIATPVIIPIPSSLKKTFFAFS